MWCLVVVVSFWVHSSCVMMRVPPPWAISRSRRSAGAAGAPEGAGIGPGAISGAAGAGNAGVCIGRKVMVVVVFRVFRMLFAKLSIDWVVMAEVDCWVLLICLVERQAVVIRSMMAIVTARVMFVFFMVLIIYCKACASESRNKLVCLYRAQPGFAISIANVTLLAKVCNRKVSVEK